LSASQRELVSEAYEQFLSRSAGVILSDYAKGVLDEEWTPKLIQRATGEGLLVAVDPKVSHFSVYRGASVVTPNQKEAVQGAEALGIRVSSEEQAGRAILKAVEADSVLMTRGDQGMTLFDEKNEIQIPTVAQEVFDVTGAGDTVIAVLTLAMAAGATIHQSALLANYAAGVVVGKLGTATVSVEELLNHLTPAENPA
jgi:D-beta-D-heptose 7-phosphate kinase/D-beta-D-heptose 1-phosphate adenosyltransferase